MKLTQQTKEELEFNDQFVLAYDYLEKSNKNVFITGKAGTGKSTLLEFFYKNTSKNVAVLAPTGVAAVNIKGQTIHSFFRFKPDITPDGVESIRLRKKMREMYQKLDTIVIDEISMVRADLLDCVDQFLRLHGKCPGIAFGGVQVVFFGDLFQLPPVVTRHDRALFTDVYPSPYFFDSNVFHEVLGKENHPQRIHIVELHKIYRQKEEKFIHLLSTIRNRSATQENLDMLNERCMPSFSPDIEDFYIYLTTTNAMADRINQERLKYLESENISLNGFIRGDFSKNNLPTHENLNLKCGAQVMLLNNDPSGRWVNGSIGRVLSIDERAETITIELSSGNIVDANPFTWEMFRFFYNEETQRLESESVGSFQQFPLKLAWAVTIHKSQGKTFSKVIVDIGTGTFSHGQIYVALSRCTSLKGLVLKKKIFKNHILLDNRVERFMQTQFSIESGIPDLSPEGEMMTEIQVIQGDITKCAADAIVNAAHTSLLGGGGVDGAIHRAAGPELLEECRALGGCEVGCAKITKGYCLPAKYVIHTVGPVFRGGNHNEGQLLKNCYQNSLDLVKRYSLKSAAFPCISTGVYRYPKREAARLAYQTVRQWCCQNEGVDVIIFVCFSQEDENYYTELIKQNDK